MEGYGSPQDRRDLFQTPHGIPPMPVPETASFPQSSAASRGAAGFFHAPPSPPVPAVLRIFRDFAVPDNFESLPAACPAPAAFRSHQTFPSDPSHNTGSRLSLFFLVRTAQSHHNGRAFPLSCLPALQIAPRLNTPVFPFLTPFPEHLLSEFFLFFTFFALDYRVTLSFIIANDSNFHKKSFPSKACLKKAFHT